MQLKIHGIRYWASGEGIVTLGITQSRCVVKVMHCIQCVSATLVSVARLCAVSSAV